MKDKSQLVLPILSLIITMYFHDYTMASATYTDDYTRPTCQDVCRHIPATREADCRRLQLQRVPSSHGCNEVTSLGIKYNHISSLTTEDLDGYGQLTHLDISRNIVFQIEEGFLDTAPFLQYLDMSFNHIERIDKGMFSQGTLSKLSYIVLNDNLISHIHDDSFQNTTELKSLILSNNILLHLPSRGFRNLLKLEHLFLSKNELTQLSKTTFQNLTSLRELCLDFNHLKSLPEGLFTGLPSLVDLDLSHNQLINIAPPVYMLAVTWLQTLDISHNHLTKLEDIGPYFNMVTRLLTEGNPFQCDCRQYQMYKGRTKYSLEIMCTPKPTVNLMSYCEFGEQLQP